MNERNEPLGPLAAGMQSSVSAKLGDIWWAFMLGGVFAGVLGIFASGSLRVCCSYAAQTFCHDRRSAFAAKLSLPQIFRFEQFLQLSDGCSNQDLSEPRFCNDHHHQPRRCPEPPL